LFPLALGLQYGLPVHLT